MRKQVVLFFLAGMVLFPTLAARAQTSPAAPANPASAALQRFYNGAKRNIQRGAEKMPEEGYAFRPTPEVRTFGGVVAHIAEGQYLFCSSIKGETSPVGQGELEKSKTTKADITAALQAAYDYCDPLFAALTDAQLGDKVQFFGRESTKSFPFTLVVAHSWEHYGNMVTYLRMKGIVPPSSEQPPPPPPATQEKPPASPQPPAEPAPAKKEPAPPKPAQPKAEPAAAPKAQLGSGDPAKGATVYARSCQKCHGPDGAGVAAIAKALKVEMKPLGSADAQKISDAEMTKAIKEGKGKMVKVSGLTDKEIADVISYVRAFKK